MEFIEILKKDNTIYPLFEVNEIGEDEPVTDDMWCRIALKYRKPRNVKLVTLSIAIDNVITDKITLKYKIAII